MFSSVTVELLEVLCMLQAGPCKISLVNVFFCLLSYEKILQNLPYFLFHVALCSCYLFSSPFKFVR